MKVFTLGVTGVIGSGKSTFCVYLKKKYKFHWIEADKLVHEKLYKAGQSGYQKIKDYFGKQFVGKKQVLRGRLRRFILKTHQKLLILNQLIHPLVIHEVNKKIIQLKQQYKEENLLKICIEATYFASNDLGKFIDKLLVVDAPDEVIIKRLKKRKIPLAQLKTLLKFQRKNRSPSSI